MIRVGITGTPGSGKTNLARSIASQCRGIPELDRVELVSEYARKYISKHGEINSIFEQYLILEKQLQWEESVCNDKLKMMVTDSPVFLGFLYSMDLPKTNSKEIVFFNDIFKKMTKLNFPVPRYDVIFHLPTTLMPVDDGIRKMEYFDEEWRAVADGRIRFIMQLFKPGLFVDVYCPVEKRADFCLDILRKIAPSETSP